MELKDSIASVKGVGPKMASNLASIGIMTIADLLDYFPRKYDDYSNVINISDIRPGLIALKVGFDNIKARRVRRSLHITEAEAYDDTGRVKVVWFNQPYRGSSLKAGTEYLLKGDYELKNRRMSIINPSIQESKDVSQNNQIVPVYSERSGVKSHQVSKIIKNILNSQWAITETLPKEIVDHNGLMPINYAYKQLHSPTDAKSLQMARQRMAFEELFIIMYASELIKREIKSAEAQPIKFNKDSAIKFVEELPFKLTDSQRAVIWQIYKDIDKAEPMNRLVEGDVGSGKTVVAAMAVLMALESGMQACFIAPTEILASQHFNTLKSLLDHTKYKNNIYLLSGSLKKSEKQTIKQKIKDHQNIILVGTHALFQKDITWNNLGLVVVDEQHRFGVNQRQALHTAGNYAPHVLCLTATPIPRSLALTVYGELDISILSKPPSTKAGYDTSIVSPNSTAQMYDKIKQSLDSGRQAYVVCPLVEQSDVLNFHSAESVYANISKREFQKYKIGLIHGRLKSAQKDAVMADFKNGKIDVLVSTTVIEVGVDVPNATEMVILSAERFGLAQLHQLRGRVGRGEHKGHCYLVLSDSNKPSKRIRLLESTNDGFELAKYDLELRGPGAIYGTRQHGELDLRFVNLSDTKLITQVRQAVLVNIHNKEIMLKYPKVAEKLQKTLQLTYLN